MMMIKKRLMVGVTQTIFMTEFGETTVTQTTLASMFPISFSTMVSNMSPRTPQPFAPLAPEKVRSLILTPFSLNYTGMLKIGELNTELLFLARAVCAPTQQVRGGSGTIGGEALLINVTFTDVTIDDVITPLVIQGLILKGNLSFSGTLTSFASIQIGYNSLQNLSFGNDVTVASLELYECVVSGTINLPPGASLTSLLVYGQYPQISLQQLSNVKLYPVLTSLLYLNGTDGKGPRDIPPGARGFGAFTLSGLTESSYPLITTLAVPDPWTNTVLETLFPNLVTLFVLGAQNSGSLVVPATPNSKYSMLTIIGANGVTNINLTDRAPYLTTGIRIVGCPALLSVALRNEPQTTQPLQEYKTLIIERCALVYLRGTRGMNRVPTTLRLGDHTSPALPTNSLKTTSSTIRLLEYVLQALPTLGGDIPAVASDYLPNVIVALAENIPSLILYPVMQTVEYVFTRPAAVVASDPTGGLTTTYTQYSGGANPVVPSGASALTNIAISVSPFGIRYTLRINSSISSVVASATTSTNSIGGSMKNSLFPADNKHLKITMIIAIIGSVILLVIGVIIAAIVASKRKVAVAVPRAKTQLSK